VNVINELVNEIEDIAEDKNAYETFRSEGVDPFKTKKVCDVFKASEISSLILKELIERVDGCDSSFASLVFLQTEEGLKDLQKKIKAKESLDTGEGGFFRSELSSEVLEPHEITPDESKAVGDFVESYEHKLDDKLENDPYAKRLYYQNIKAQDALKGNRNGSFRRE
jgi:hypothetical protein